MDTLLGIVFVIIWSGLGFVGSSIRSEKGYDTGSLGAILWGGGLYFLGALILPPRKRF